MPGVIVLIPSEEVVLNIKFIDVGLALAVTSGFGFIVTNIAALAPSQATPLVVTVWLTKYVVLPAVAVDGVGAVADPVPPVAAVYHNKLVPVADNADAVAFKQYTTGVVTVGAAVDSFTVTVPEDEVEQPLTPSVTATE